MIYQIDVAMFLDTNDDGIGDLRGTTERLEHVRGLGANAIWLLPFYRSPYRDGGYDVIDHLTVDPRFGDNADIAHLLNEADSLGLRVILDLVAQHTSIDHPWFQEARRDRSSPYRDYYVWSDEPEESELSPVFPTEEDSIWTWDEEAQQFYRHVFYSHEPDLDLGNPAVREELYRVMEYWLRMGVSGFRVDAAPFMVERARAADARSDGLWLMEDMREFVSLRHPEAVLIGEVNLLPDQSDDYLGDDDRLTLVLDFWKNNHIFLALAREDAGPLTKAIEEQPDARGFGRYATFLRNHDELDLERLTEQEMAEVGEKFAPEKKMWAYERGLRRRLGPILDGDVRRIAMAHALLMSLPGTPILLYGDEIGMGENLDLPERRSVRIPMQWSDAQNAGFSRAPAEQLIAPVTTDGPYAFQKLNVYAQMSDPDSLLARIGHLVRTRLGAFEIGSGGYEVVDTGCPAVFCLRHEHDGRFIITSVNLSNEQVECTLPGDDATGLVDILSDDQYPPVEDDPTRFSLNGYGYRWLRRGDELLG